MRPQAGHGCGHTVPHDASLWRLHSRPLHMPSCRQRQRVLAHSAQLDAHSARPAQCLLPVWRTLADRPMHDAGDGRIVVPLLQPVADELPFAVALELHACRDGRAPAAEPAPGGCREEMNSFQLHYVLQGQAQLVQDGQALGEVCAGDSLLMSSAAACRADAGSRRAHPDWHLAVLTLVLGVHQDSGSDTDDTRGMSLSAQPVVDTAVAQQVADGWQAGPVVGTLSAAMVRGILADAQVTAQRAVFDSPGQQQTVHIDGTPADSVRTSSTQQAAISALPALVGAESLLPNSNAGSTSSEAVSEDGDGASAANNAWETNVGSAWAAASSALLQRVPRQLAATLQQLQQHWAVRHLEASLGAPSNSGPQAVQRRRLRDLLAYKLPGQTNRLALLFNPLDDGHLGVPFTFGLEIFEPDHKTPPHVHDTAHELFFILSGSGTAFCDGQRFSVSVGDVVIFPPKSVHGIDNGSREKLFCLELMLPNEMFAEFVKRGLLDGGLSDEDLCTLVAEECGYMR